MYTYIYVYIISMSVCLHLSLRPTFWMDAAGFEPAGGGEVVQVRDEKSFATRGPRKKPVRHENHASCIQSPGNTLLKQIHSTPASKLAFVISFLFRKWSTNSVLSTSMLIYWKANPTMWLEPWAKINGTTSPEAPGERDFLAFFVPTFLGEHIFLRNHSDANHCYHESPLEERTNVL